MSTTSTSTFSNVALAFDLSCSTRKGYTFSVQRLLSGSIGMSALYCFKILVKVVKTPGSAADTSVPEAMSHLLGTHAAVTLSMSYTKREETITEGNQGSPGKKKTKVTENNRELLTICGSIMSIESVVGYENSTSSGWYIWTLRPPLAKACYSRNRTAFEFKHATGNTKENKTQSNLKADTPTVTTSKELLTYLLEKRWGVSFDISETAEEQLPDLIQVIQNDESDYNFFTRLLSTWGLGYYWSMDTDRATLHIISATNQNKTTGKNAAADDSSLPIIEPAPYPQSAWKINYGLYSLTANNALITENYNQQNQATSPIFSLYDNTWDQYQDPSKARKLQQIFRSAHDNGADFHGKLTLDRDSRDLENRISTLQQLSIGAKAKFASDAWQCSDNETFYITSLQFEAADAALHLTCHGRRPQNTSGFGIMPNPVRLNDSPDIMQEELITEKAWPEPRMRIFLATVVSITPYGSRNLCQVHELSAKSTTVTTSVDNQSCTIQNTFWVELSSPFADNDSGLLTRPRKDNVLVCLDRGDMSIPLAIGSLFRDNNAVPFAELHTLNRKKREKATSNVTDYSAVTLRNRARIPARTYLLEQKQYEETEGVDLQIRDNQTTGSTTRSDIEATRPMSVNDLASKRLPFNQIQIISQDNGVQPIEQNPKLSDTYFFGALAETIVGITSDSDLSSYVTVNAAKDAQTTLNSTISKPHFEGINIYSNSDFLLQSADHQIINAGGEIVITAAQAITLRVGKSYIRIGEDGVELSCPLGRISKAGAYAAYNTPENSQVAKCSPSQGMPLGGSLVVGANGVSMKGPYITNTATNMFKASTFFGSSMSLSDFSCKITSPETTIIGGASIYRTVSALADKGIFKTISDICKSEKSSSLAYTGPLMDGRKLNAPSMSNMSATVNSSLAYTSSMISSFMNMGNGFKNLFSLQGSALKLSPDELSATSAEIKMNATVAQNLTTIAAAMGAFALELRSAVAKSSFQEVLSFTSSLASKANTFSDLLNSKFANTDKWKAVEDAFSLITGTTCSQKELETAIKNATNNLPEDSTNLATYNKRISEAEDGAKERSKSNTKSIFSSLAIGVLLAALDVALRIAINKRENNPEGVHSYCLDSVKTLVRAGIQTGSRLVQSLNDRRHAASSQQAAVQQEGEDVSQRMKVIENQEESATQDSTSGNSINTAVVRSDDSSARKESSGVNTLNGSELHQ